jgi:RimJ/RimL family protein N-acetyltransferase
MLSKPPLEGQRVVLRALGPADAEAMFESIQDPEAVRLTGSHGTFTREMIAAHCARVAAADDRLDYVIALRGDPTYRGEVVLRHIDPDNRCASYRINLAAWAPRGAGLGGEATVLLLRHGFAVWPLLHRVELEVYDFNARAIRAYEKLGFVREGHKRDSLWWDGRFHGAVQMSLLRPEFEALHGSAG